MLDGRWLEVDLLMLDGRWLEVDLLMLDGRWCGFEDPSPALASVIRSRCSVEKKLYKSNIRSV